TIRSRSSDDGMNSEIMRRLASVVGVCLVFATAAVAQTPPAEAGMVTVPAGCFQMGDAFGMGHADEQPVHRVCLDAFRLDPYEVTTAAYLAVMPDTLKRGAQCPTCPVDSVTWQQAKEYCEKIGKRLPTEAEWEYAAREGGKPVKYGTGTNTITDASANFTNDEYRSRGLKPVGSYPPNALGLYDMTGNVWEWVSDMYMETYYRVSPENNPKGPARGFPYRVLRGGGWHFNSGGERAATRAFRHPTHMDDDVGVRCAA